MYHIGDVVETEYGNGTVVGILNKKIIIQFYENSKLPESILENKHGVGFWLYLPEDVDLPVISENTDKKRKEKNENQSG